MFTIENIKLMVHTLQVIYEDYRARVSDGPAHVISLT